MHRGAITPASVEDGDRRREVRLRHALMGWREWILREFLRYMYALGVLALLVMGPLQMQAAWLPLAKPPVMESGVVGAIALAFVLSVAYLSVLGYRFVWGRAGFVDRMVGRTTQTLDQQPEAGNEGGP